MNFRVLLLLSFLVTISNGYKVLFLSPVNGKSHWLYMQTFVKALLDRGHEVTFVTSNTLSDLKLTNYTEVLIDPPLDLSNSGAVNKMIEETQSPFAKIWQLNGFTKMMNAYNMKSASVQKLIHSKGLHFDVIVYEDFFSDSFLMLAHKFNAPVVSICPIGGTEYNDYQNGLLTPSSFVPHWLLTYLDNMTFTERWYNSLVALFDYTVRRFVYLPSEEAFAHEMFSHLKPLPSMDELLQRISVVLVNTHRAVSPPRPAMPNVINIGGAHIKPAKPLPEDIKKFIDESKDGVIYFSLGTVVKSSILPKEKVQMFLDTFKNLKQRVLWKFEDESLTDIPPNVMIRKWMPQNDILAHPNIVLFISHGGAFGTSESLYHGVPLLLFPFFGDQHRNAHRIAATGYGKFLIFNEVTRESFSAALSELTTDKKFLAKARETSAIFKDNAIHPMQEAMFWIEHAAKFRGAKHLKSHAVNMSWFSYLLLDVLIVNLIGVLSIVFVLFYIARRFVSKKKTDQKPGKKRN